MRWSLPMPGGRRSGLGRRLDLENETSPHLSIPEEPHEDASCIGDAAQAAPSNPRPELTKAQALQIMLTLSILSTIIGVVRYGLLRGATVCCRAQLEVKHVTARS
jgi:hypothetical protein